MPQKSQNRPPLQQTPAMQTAYSNTVADTLQGDDDDDICPVCESECTCNIQAPSVSSAPIPQSQSQPQSSQSSSLKIRLTVPPSMLLHTQPRPTAPPSKQKMTTSASVRNGGSAPQENTPPLVKRKRGRPTKAEAEARRAAANMERAPSPVNPTKPSPASNKTKTARKLSNKQQKSKANARGRPQQRRFEDESNTSSDEEEEASPARHYKRKAYSSDGEAAKRVDNTGLDSDLSELSSLPDPGDESSLEAEEERYIIQEATPREHDKSRVKRELLGDDNSRRFGRSNQNGHGWEVRTSRRSLSADVQDSSSDSDTETEEGNDSEGQEGDEEDADADEDADMEGPVPTFLPTRRGIWSDIDSTEEDFDADVFFASLSDSDTSTAEFEHVFQAPHGDDAEGEETERMDAVQIEDTFGAGLLGPFAANPETTVLVSRDLSGQPVFTGSTDFSMGMLDLDFELNIVAQQRSITERNSTFPSTTSAAEDDEMWIASDTEEADLDSEHGDTTDDDISILKGVQTASGVVMFRFPTPPISSINPLSTLSPMPKKSSKSSCAKKRKAFEKSQHRHPIYQNTKYPESNSKQSHQNPVTQEDGDEAASDSGHSSSLSSSKKHPTMGRFETQCGPLMRHVIINGDGKNIDIPSPISPETLNRARTRARRDSGSSRGRKRGSIRNESPLSALSRRHARSPVSSRSISTDTRTKSSHDNSEAGAPPPVTPIDIDEVLDSSLMDHLMDGNEGDNGAGGRSEADTGSKHLDRWDRVPMGAFRQTRHIGARASVADGLTSVMEWAPNQPSAISDGFCYGSPGGSLMRSRTLPLFEQMGIDSSRRHSTLQQFHLGSPTSLKRSASGFDSGADGDRTPTGRSSTDITSAFGNTPEEAPLPKILSHKARRKAKRRLIPERDN